MTLFSYRLVWLKLIIFNIVLLGNAQIFFNAATELKLSSTALKPIYSKSSLTYQSPLSPLKNLKYKRSSKLPYPPKKKLSPLQDFFEISRYAAHWAHFSYCRSKYVLDPFSPDGNIKAAINHSQSPNILTIYFSGPQLSKGEWASRKSNLVTFNVKGRLSDPTIRIDNQWYINFISFAKVIFGTIQDVYQSFPNKGTKLLFTGHGIGGAIAAITALTWKIRTADTPGLRDIPIITVTFGAPRIGNEKLARLMNKMLRVRRFTNTNDYVPHFPQIKNGVDILRHHETEYWIFPKSCDCPQDSEIYMCQGYFYPTRSWQIVGSFDEFLSLEGISSGENPECKSGQIISEIPDDFVYHGYYFGYEMGVCN